MNNGQQSTLASYSSHLHRISKIHFNIIPPPHSFDVFIPRVSSFHKNFPTKMLNAKDRSRKAWGDRNESAFNVLPLVCSSSPGILHSSPIPHLTQQLP